MIWRRDLSQTELFSSLAVDPLDRRRLVACGTQGALALVQLGSSPHEEEVEIKQFRVNLTPPGRCIAVQTASWVASVICIGPRARCSVCRTAVICKVVL